MLNIGMEQQQQIRASDGSILWRGAQVVAVSYVAKSSEASATFLMGEAAAFDSSTAAISTIPRQETTAAGASPSSDLPQSLIVGMKRSPASANAVLPWLGVVQEPVAPGKLGLVAGVGSLTTVIVASSALTLGNILTASATAGVLAFGTPAAGANIGPVLKINTTGATGTGGTGFAGIMVLPS